MPEPEYLGIGVHEDVPDAVYHADPVEGGSLSSTGARKLLPPSTPAKFRYWLDHPQPPKAEFDLGHAVHRRTLGVGPVIDRIDHPSWSTKAAKAARAEAYEAGRVPLLAHQVDAVEEMHAALMKHRGAAALLRGGRRELTLIWQHERTGVMRRARIDHLRDATADLPVINVDLKSCTDASDEACEKAIYNHGYYQQGAWYEAGIVATGLHPAPITVLIFQEVTPPYAVNVVQLDEDARAAGRLKNDQALNVYAECTRTGRWPGYGDGVTPTLLTLPRWALAREGL